MKTLIKIIAVISGLNALFRLWMVRPFYYDNLFWLWMLGLLACVVILRFGFNQKINHK
jgi:hypothetical protein